MHCCLYQAKELESRDYLSPEEKNIVEFVHTLESMYSQQSFTESIKNLSNSNQKCRFVTNSYIWYLDTMQHKANQLTNHKIALGRKQDYHNDVYFTPFYWNIKFPFELYVQMCIGSHFLMSAKCITSFVHCLRETFDSGSF